MQRDVVIVGYRLNAREPAAKALERILGLKPEDARRIARSFPAVVATRVADERAQSLAAELKDAGAQVEVRAAAPSLPRVSAAAEAAAALVAEAPKPRAPRVAAAPTETSGAYQLGDFGLERPARAGKAPTATAPHPSAPHPSAPHPSVTDPAEALSLDLELEPSAALELDRPEQRAAPRAQPPAMAPSSDGRFDSLAPPAKLPEVEEQAFRSIQRAPRARDSRSQPPAPSVGGRLRRAIAGALTSWLPSLLTLAAVSASTLLAVGYALDPADPLDALRNISAPSMAASVPDGRPPTPLHPLLRSAPEAVRGPLSAILRARIAGVHQVPVSYEGEGPVTIDCVLVERAGEQTSASLAALKETGRPVDPPPAIAAQLREHARALEATARRKLDPIPICLAP